MRIAVRKAIDIRGDPGGGHQFAKDGLGLGGRLKVPESMALGDP